MHCPTGLDECFVSALVRLRRRRRAVHRRTRRNARATDNGTPAAKDDQARALIDELRPDAGQHGEWRIERVVTETGLDRKAAAAEIDRIDRARNAHLRDWYNVDIGSPAIVDLAIDTATFGNEGAAALIVAAVHAR